MKHQISGETKERSILFSGEMVKAILDGRKTQTRRIVNPQPSDDFTAESWGEVHKMVDGDFPLRNGSPIVIGWGASNSYGDEAHVCKHGKPGDRLWVKETFYFDLLPFANGGRLPKQKPEDAEDALYYPADSTKENWHCELIPECSCCEVGVPKLRPSIFMPRWASRITLEIANVRVERLNEISTDDAEAEGALSWWNNLKPTGGGRAILHPKEAYQKLWESINSPGSWALNPWVWVIEFKTLETPEEGGK